MVNKQWKCWEGAYTWSWLRANCQMTQHVQVCGGFESNPSCRFISFNSTDITIIKNHFLSWKENWDYFCWEVTGCEFYKGVMTAFQPDWSRNQTDLGKIEKINCLQYKYIIIIIFMIKSMFSWSYNNQSLFCLVHSRQAQLSYTHDFEFKKNSIGVLIEKYKVYKQEKALSPQVPMTARLHLVFCL